MKIKNTPKSGFTLLELMIGAAILIFAISGLIAAYTGCFALNESAGNLTIASNHIQCVMEEIRDRNIIDNITQEDWTAWAAADPPAGGGCNTLGNETVQVSYPSGIIIDPLRILVTITWSERGRVKNIQAVNLLTER
ncbi:MAG: hypothetical protein KKH08_07415 [Candidatus Omnitrophica bacterium]|nr:hypothetical protein [Candidatus Omnitrophota bacterium]